MFTNLEPQKNMERSGALGDVLELLLHFGAAMMRSGNTAIRTREWMEVIACKMGCDTTAVNLAVDTIEVNITRDSERAMSMCEIGPPGINAWRISELEQLAKAAEPGVSTREVTAKLVAIEDTPSRVSFGQIAIAVGAASAGFSFLNGASIFELIAAGVGGGAGQWSRSLLGHRGLNQFGSAVLSAITASGIYVVVAELIDCISRNSI